MSPDLITTLYRSVCEPGPGWYRRQILCGCGGTLERVHSLSFLMLKLSQIVQYKANWYLRGGIIANIKSKLQNPVQTAQIWLT
jgi:hypothetical protein